jgi:hypothetical protein
LIQVRASVSTGGAGSWNGRPVPDARVLYQNMMRVWRNRFTAASALTFIATVLFGFAVLGIEGWLAGLALVAGSVLVWWWHRSRPLSEVKTELAARTMSAPISRPVQEACMRVWPAWKRAASGHGGTRTSPMAAG